MRLEKWIESTCLAFLCVFSEIFKFRREKADRGEEEGEVKVRSGKKKTIGLAGVYV